VPRTIPLPERTDLKLIQRAALKPEQKLDLIRRILLPAQMHTLRLSRRVLLVVGQSSVERFSFHQQMNKCAIHRMAKCRA
jgi:hypothetical protein